MLKLKRKQASTLSKLAAAVIAATVGCGSASGQQSPARGSRARFRSSSHASTSPT